MSNFDRKCVGDGVLLRALDQELAPRQARLVNLHLDHCESCRARMEAMRRVTSQVGELKEGVLPPDDVRAFLARLEWEAASKQPELSKTRWFATPRTLWQQAAWCGAVMLLILVGVRIWAPHPHTTVSQITRPPLMTVAPLVPKQLVASTRPAKPVRRVHRWVKKQAPPAAVASEEAATPFFPLPFSDAALPLDQASVIRVELPRSALEWTGLPVEENRREERIRADLVLGADGLARAIRFVR
jgi:hypothetical protein